MQVQSLYSYQRVISTKDRIAIRVEKSSPFLLHSYY